MHLLLSFSFHPTITGLSETLLLETKTPWYFLFTFFFIITKGQPTEKKKGCLLSFVTIYPLVLLFL
jgi:hypothetical protein